jgi:hypothetical protein
MAANDYNGGHSPPYETGLYPKDWGDTGLEIHLDGGE